VSNTFLLPKGYTTVLSMPILAAAVMLLCASLAVAELPLDKAIAADDTVAVQKLVEADRSQLNGDALHAAARANAIGVAKWLVEHGADFYARDNNGQLALDVPPGEELNDTRKYLRSINDRRNEFLSAIARDDVEAVKKLLAADKSLAGARDIADGWSGVMMACHFGRTQILEALLVAGASVKASDFYTGYDAVYVCAEQGKADCLKIVLKAGADPKATWRVSYGRLPMEMNALHVAAWKKHPAVIAVLLEAGLDVNARAKSYTVFSPLHFAVSEGDVPTVEALLKAGADRQARDGRRNITALQMAEAGKHAEVIELLKKQ
jgi:ankyrin repeat protein